MTKTAQTEDKITSVITDRQTLGDFLNLTYDEFIAFYPEISIITYFNTITRLLDILNQTFIKEHKKISDIDGTWILDRCLYNNIDPDILFTICS